MINIELTELKMLTAAWAESTLGKCIFRPNEPVEWNTLTGYMADVAPEWPMSLSHPTEMRALDWIVRRLAPASKVVEVGSFMGVSAAVMAHANPLVQVVSIDVFDKDGGTSPIQQVYTNMWSEKVDEFLGVGAVRSRDACAHRLAHYSNLTLVEGTSPDDFHTSELKDIDLYFEDADHDNPGLAGNLEFWCARVKPGGLVLVHDYKPWLPPMFNRPPRRIQPTRMPDVIIEVARLIEQGYELLGTVSSLAILRKPYDH
jgi:SAM-dependent methyltransferase